jgi:O-antigen ligase/Flp pilus assembly protein TadD
VRVLAVARAFLREEGATVLPATAAIAVLIAWTATGGGYESRPALGGYDPDPWYLGALAIVGLCGATALGLRRIRMSRWTAMACAALACYVGWSFLSVQWAHDQGSAFLGSDRALVYLAAFTLFAILPWRPRSITLMLALLVAGLGAIALVAMVKVGTMAEPSSLFVDARLAYPLGYENASAALFMLTAVTAIALCAIRQAPAPLRVGGLVIAAICLQLAVLLATLAILPGRLRFLLFALGPAAAAAAATPSLLKVYASSRVHGTPLVGPRLAAALHISGRHAMHSMLLADGVLLVAMSVLVALDRRMVLSASAQRRVSRTASVATAVAVIAGVSAGLLATHGHVVRRVETAWSSFANASASHSGTSRFTSLGSQRVDFWRVALDEFDRHPLQGIGQDNFADTYARYRHTDQEPRWTHSLELRLLLHTGIVGAALFLLFLLAGLIAALRARRGRGDVTIAIALVPLIVWLVHGSIDWFWEFPALTVPALGFLAAAGALRADAAPRETRVTSATDARAGESSGEQSETRRSTLRARWRGSAAAAGVLSVTIAALVAIGIPFAVARQVQRAIAVWPDRPALAYARLRSASSLMPFQAQIDLVGGAIALNRGEASTAREWLGKAQRKDDENWLAPFALGLLDGEGGQRSRARAELLRARSLDPREPVITDALTGLRAARPLTFAQAQRILGERAQSRFGR